MRVLLKFGHGLGDAVQFTSVVNHLRRHYPEWQLSVQALVGKHSVFYGMVDNVYTDRDPRPADTEYDAVHDIAWHECDNSYADSPSTKAERCLREQFGITPEWPLCRYAVRVGTSALDRARDYLAAIGATGKAVLLHYQGNTACHAKNLTHDVAKIVCDRVMAAGCVPIILDWDGRSPLPNGKTIFCPDASHHLWQGYGTGDGETIAALAQLSRLVVAIDSGPGHVAGSTDTTTLVVWTGHHPIHYYAPADNVLHVVPRDHATRIHGQSAAALAAFIEHYRSVTYDTLGRDLGDLVDQSLGREPTVEPLVKSGAVWVRRDNIEQDMVIVRDICDNDAYKLGIIPGIVEQAKFVVDIGAHIGCFAKMIHDRNPDARIVCVEVCPENIDALQRNVGKFATIIQAACTYESGELALLNAVFPNCRSTGGSVVVPAERLGDGTGEQRDYVYQHDRRPIEKVTLEQICERLGADRIDLLKLDCEGSEISILGKTPSLSRIRFVVGEWHDRKQWETLLAARFAGWGYGIMYEHASTGMGLFHLANRTWPPTEYAPLIESLRRHIVVGDDTAFEANRDWYAAVQEIASQVRPRAVVEFGVRAGYGARAVLEVVPDCRITGIDADIDEPSRGYWRHAETLGTDYSVIVARSQDIRRIPNCDMVLVDGDHTYSGCRHDLQLAMESAPHIVVDDCHAGSDVQRACMEAVASDSRWEHVSLQSSRVAYLRRKRRALSLAFPSGIGDALWVLAKVPALLRREKADAAAVTVCRDETRRSEAFIRSFEFVDTVDYCDLSIVDSPQFLADGCFNYAPSQPRWHNRFDWLLQANGHLERGGCLEDWLPDLATDWRVMERFRWRADDLEFAKRFKGECGPYAVLYFGPESGNTTAGHNRGGLWSPEEWVSLAESIRNMGVEVIAVGAEWDRSYFTRHIRPKCNCIRDCIGQWDIRRTLAVLKLSAFVIGYQSGIPITAAFMGVRGGAFWRPHGDSILADQYVTFSERMASAWVPPHMLESGDWLPLIYGRDTAATIAKRIEGWKWA